MTKTTGCGAFVGMLFGALLGIIFGATGMFILGVIGAIVGEFMEAWHIKKKKSRIYMPGEIAEKAKLEFPEIVTELPKGFSSYNPDEETLTVNLKDSEATVQILTFGLNVKVKKIIFDFGDEKIEMDPEEWKEFLRWFFKNNMKKERKQL